MERERAEPVTTPQPIDSSAIEDIFAGLEDLLQVPDLSHREESSTNPPLPSRTETDNEFSPEIVKTEVLPAKEHACAVWCRKTTELIWSNSEFSSIMEFQECPPYRAFTWHSLVNLTRLRSEDPDVFHDLVLASVKLGRLHKSILKGLISWYIL
jgi:hypothetical protein